MYADNDGFQASEERTLALALDELPPEILLGSESIVVTAAEREVPFGGFTTASEGEEMVELETVRLTAAPPRVTGVSAARLVQVRKGCRSEILRAKRGEQQIAILRL